MILDFIIWKVNPEIFSVGPLSIRWYGLLFALSFVSGYMIFMKYLREGKMTDEIADKLLIYLAIGTVVGARLGHVLFYDFDYYLKNPLEIIMIMHGGLASHGASLGILLAVFIFSRKYKFNFFWLFDRLAIVAALGGVLIRTGNLMNSEIYGLPTTLPWGFIFVRAGEILPMHPTQIYEAVVCLVIFIAMFLMYTKTKIAQQTGKLFGFFLVTLFTSRFLIEFIKNPQSGFERSMALDMGQILSIPFVLLGIYLLVRKAKALE